MGLIKKIDVDRYLAERRATRLGPLSQAGHRIERTTKVKSGTATAFNEVIEAVPVACDSDGTNVSQSRQA